MLLHNDHGGPEEAATAVVECFAGDLAGMRTALAELGANFAVPDAQGPSAYVSQMLQDHEGFDASMLAADAVVAVETFLGRLTSVSH